MILSERVSGKMSRWGILFAALLAVATAPSWSLGQSAGRGGSAPQQLSDFEKRLLQELRQKENDSLIAEALNKANSANEREADLARSGRANATAQQLTTELQLVEVQAALVKAIAQNRKEKADGRADPKIQSEIELLKNRIDIATAQLQKLLNDQEAATRETRKNKLFTLFSGVGFDRANAANGFG